MRVWFLLSLRLFLHLMYLVIWECSQTKASSQGRRFCITPHLNGKKLSTNSSWDFEHVFETMDDYWVGPDENFFPESTPTRWRCDHFSKKWSKSKSDTTLSIKKPFVTPNFCGRNFSTMHHFWVWIFLSPKIDEYLV